MVEDKNINVNLYKDYEKNFSIIDDILKNSPDIIRRKVILNSGKKGCFFFVQGLCDIDLFQRDFMTPLLKLEKLDSDDIKYLPSKIFVAGLTFPLVIDSLIKDILAGNAVFICEGLSVGISCTLKKYEKRSIQEPEGEKSIRGDHDGFIEDMATNIATIRRKLKTPNLKFKDFTVGNVSHQTVSVAYIENIANPNLLQIITDKINQIDTDSLIAIGYLEQIIADHPNSIFPQYLATERPDKAIAGLLEGKFVIMLQETSFVLIAPVTFHAFTQAPEDYTTHWIGATYLRLLRTIATLIALFLPGTYIALLSYHYYMIPLPLLVSLAESRTKVPFPPVIEAFLIEFMIEMVREASIRLPSFITASISIVGGLVIGQTAIQAGVASDLMVIIIAASAIAGFTMPTYDLGISIRLCKYITMITSSIFGILGVVVPIVTLLAHLLVLDSLGEPYFQPIAPFKFGDLKDTYIRAPIRYLKKRPDVAKPKNKERGKKNG
ncbi:spore germination protein [Clostridium estertheticum]|uniref:spore germination protein n=1 Tax=Clostridium estertheticum TaxID=238834 RepID=UPI001C7CA73A|nr:spore germination protein [Clostridium estertheticum]MBX4260015.1 spore germination protein [Clostridium estertheticum]WLC72034.1 spore germination protein [Clostridium estertheticum]